MVDDDAGQKLGSLGSSAGETAFGTMPDLNITLMAMGAAICFSMVSEAISWFMIYRHEEYKKAIAEIVELQNRVESMQEKMQYSAGAQSLNQQKAQQRKLQVQMDTLKSRQSGMMVRKTRGMIGSGLFMIVGMGLLNSWFSGTVAARLPFTPWAMASNLTHYGITSPDMTLCSVTFIFVMTNMSIGAYLKKFIALEGPRVS